MSTTTIPYKKLFAWDGNVRKTGSRKGTADLAASIAAHGLLHFLVVRKDKHGRYAVIAGRRRLLALKALVDAKTSQPNMPTGGQKNTMRSRGLRRFVQGVTLLNTDSNLINIDKAWIGRRVRS
ncbi:MAG: ParB/Srx family N-terminal domain-containing protein [Terracidiphilus sp.]|jgi:hypothetical protein